MNDITETLNFLIDIGDGIPLSEKPIHHLEWARQHSVPLQAIEKHTPPVKKSRLAPNEEYRKQAEELAYNCQNLLDLRKALESFNGCALKKTATHTVFSDGQPDAKVMFIGEAPGAEEDRQGKPFVGQSGQLLDKIIRFAGFSRQENIYITNTIPWRPPGNRQPTAEENYICMPFLERHIELVRPKYIVMLGGTCLKTLHNPKEGIVKLRGKWIPYVTSHEKFSVDSMAIFHPAFLLRSPGQKRWFWKDILELRQRIDHDAS